MSSRFHNPLLILFLLALSLTACQNKKSISGKAFIDREVLVDVLVDMHLADAATNDRKFNRKFDADSIDILMPILEKYHVTRQMFDTTMYEYTRNPELLDLVYNDVLIKLNVMVDELSKEDASIQEE